MSEQALTGQVALVTGGAKRIGRSIALALAGAGARVAVHYNASKVDAEATQREIEQQGGEAFPVQGDIGKVAEAKRVAAATLEHFGRVDILVNNAGVWEPHDWDKITEADFDRFLDVNLKAQFFLTQAVAPQMKQRGRGVIVNLASVGGLKAWPRFIPYCVSKAGVIMLTRTLARALAPEIRVNAVAPGAIQFPGEELNESYIRKTPLGRTGAAEDIAQAVLFLCTSAEFITGQILVVDGGFTLT
ncbi:MAG: glucose 1-dehydrogenase [Acidobacteria bacterium]|nr:glucose 1-dehydrogenase [Acidobacteriota bacterium]